MKKLLLFVIICLSGHTAMAQNTSSSSTEVAYQDSTAGFSFEINYWFNLHHFLWMESFMSIEIDSTIIDQDLSAESQESLNQALEYYKRNLAGLNLRADDYMSEFRQWITNEGRELKSVPNKFHDHAEVLENVSDVYKELFWPVHKKACEKVLKDNIDIIRRTEFPFAEGIIKLTRQRWQSEKIKVDITYYGTATTRNPKHRAYTSLFPTHVVMNAMGEDEIEGNWLEILYHESAHHLILGSSYFVGGTIQDISEVMQIDPPRQLEHAYLFYLTGELTKQLLKEEEIPYDTTYMQREGVFSSYYSALDKHLKRYMNREVTLEDATRNVIAELNQE